MKDWLRNPLRRFIVIFVFSYLAIIAIGQWAGLREVYRDSIVKGTTKVFMNWWADGIVKPDVGTDPSNEGMDMLFILLNRKANQEAIDTNKSVFVIKVYQNSWQAGYLLTAFLLSLVFASPVPLKRKMIAASLGFLLLQMYVFFRFWINIEYSFQSNMKLDVVSHGAFLQSTITFLDAVFMKNIVVSFTVPLLLWALVTFQRGDFARISRIFIPQKPA